jgi:hypothetical protein
MFLNKSDLKNNILKCDQCNLSFDEYCQSKFLPCFKTICTKCEMTIHREAINKRFKCEVCSKDHLIPDDGFLSNEMAFKIITTEPMDISRGENYDKLELNVDKIESLARKLKSDFENSIDKIKEHCLEQMRLVQLSTENAIEKLHNLNKELIDMIAEYEKKYIEFFLVKKDSISKNLDTLIEEVNMFSSQKKT